MRIKSKLTFNYRYFCSWLVDLATEKLCIHFPSSLYVKYQIFLNYLLSDRVRGTGGIGQRQILISNIISYPLASFFPFLLCQVKYLTKNYVKINIIFDLLSCHFYRVSYRVKNEWQKDLEKTNISLKYRLTFSFAIFIRSCRK